VPPAVVLREALRQRSAEEELAAVEELAAALLGETSRLEEFRPRAGLALKRRTREAVGPEPRAQGA
jgi:hypothetical protein